MISNDVIYFGFWLEAYMIILMLFNGIGFPEMLLLFEMLLKLFELFV